MRYEISDPDIRNSGKTYNSKPLELENELQQPISVFHLLERSYNSFSIQYISTSFTKYHYEVKVDKFGIWGI